MPVKKLENIERGSIICDPNDPKQIYKVIEKITVFDGFDCEGDYSYGVSKTIARCKNIGNGSKRMKLQAEVVVQANILYNRHDSGVSTPIPCKRRFHSGSDRAPLGAGGSAVDRKSRVPWAPLVPQGVIFSDRINA